ncbi:hypothetical protein [Cohnella kolymensis]|uniref:hypothetical protein n=1 Tax=Cohnella kolymensis TaxID=1590652 RepID=UPI00137921EF|nr:hypothetical protein [Cohnella kolymensis]
MKKWQFVVENSQDQPSLERLAAMLNRTTVGTETAVDSVQWELSREDGFICCQFPLGPSPEDKKKLLRQSGPGARRLHIDGTRTITAAKNFSISVRA